MSSTASNAHTVQVVSASVTLLSLLSNMSADQWSSITVANTVDLDPTGTGDGWLSQSPRGEWDTLHNLSRTWGGNHGDTLLKQRYWMSGYVDSTQSYITPIAVQGGLTTQNAHGFYGGPAIDQQTGDVYGAIAYVNNTDIVRYTYATGAWDYPFPSNSLISGHSSGIAVAYHPGLYGGAGGLVTGSNTGIWTSRLPRTGSPVWNIVMDATNSVQGMDDFPVCAYNRKDSCVYMGGGGGSSWRKLWKVAAGGVGGIGVATQVTYPAGITLYEWTSNSSASALVAAGDSTKSMVAISDTGSIVQYNEAGDSWSAIAAVVPSALWNGSTANKWWNLCSVPAPYNCIIAMQGGSNTRTTTTLYVWKH